MRLSFAIVLAAAAPALAVLNPYTETFSSPAASWSSSAVFTPLNYPSSGGPDGSGYGSAPFGFAGNVNGDFPIMFRAQGSFGSSAGAFVGDWLGAGVTTFSFSVRDSVPFPVQYFARFSSGGPGVVALESTPVAPNTWTTFSIGINPSTPFIYEGAPTLFGQTFGAMDRLQIGVVVDANLAGQAGPFTFDVDNVAIAPAPASGAVLLLGLAGRRRRR
jgi:hypothetical protein